MVVSMSIAFLMNRIMAIHNTLKPLLLYEQA